MSQANSVIWTQQDQCTYELRDCGSMHKTCTRINLDRVSVLKVVSWHRVQFLTKKLSTIDNPLAERKLVFSNGDSLNILATLQKGPMSMSSWPRQNELGGIFVDILFYFTLFSHFFCFMGLFVYFNIYFVGHLRFLVFFLVIWSLFCF